MIYRNTLTGIEFESDSVCTGKNIVVVEPKAEKTESEAPMPKKSKGTKKK